MGTAKYGYNVRKLGLGSINSELYLSTTWNKIGTLLLVPTVKGEKKWEIRSPELKTCSNLRFQNSHIPACHEDFLVCSCVTDMGTQLFLIMKKRAFHISQSPWPGNQMTEKY